VAAIVEHEWHQLAVKLNGAIWVTIGMLEEVLRSVDQRQILSVVLGLDEERVFDEASLFNSAGLQQPSEHVLGRTGERIDRDGITILKKQPERCA
jgi:hypothetical protein